MVAPPPKRMFREQLNLGEGERSRWIKSEVGGWEEPTKGGEQDTAD